MMMRALLVTLLFGLQLAHATTPQPPRKTADSPVEWLDVGVGQSYIYKERRPISRVLVSDGEIAEVKLLEAGQFQIRGLSVGSTDLWVWFQGRVSAPVHYQLTIHQDISDLIRRVDEIVDGTPPKVYPLRDRLVIEGPVPDLNTAERLADVATVYDPDFINLMTVEGDHQIQLEVVFAEVNRSALRELGFNALWGDNSLGFGVEGPLSSTAATATNPANTLINGGSTLAPSAEAFKLLGVVGGNVNLSAIMSVLSQHSISKILAQPTLVALSGQQAEFLAGGEVPIPVSQFGNKVTIEFKEYGVKLVFVPTVLGDEVVDMQVYVEVSDVDNTNSIRLTGIEIPSFISRKTQSHLRLKSGNTFAMAGMLNDTVRATFAKVPLLGDIPIVGSLFRYVKHRRDETELMIFVTPRLVRPLAPGRVPAPPGVTIDNNPNDFELFMLGLDHRAGSETAAPTGPMGLSR
ncbi:MAG: pilus assembly protein N-terminal domain-containing protein [Myxococcota bacterium]|nr:pilus assembly protein N-terminal domain-containing protein [Myxococcota bacterium]